LVRDLGAKQNQNKSTECMTSYGKINSVEILYCWLIYRLKKRDRVTYRLKKRDRLERREAHIGKRDFRERNRPPDSREERDWRETRNGQTKQTGLFPRPPLPVLPLPLKIDSPVCSPSPPLSLSLPRRPIVRSG